MVDLSEMGVAEDELAGAEGSADLVGALSIISGC